MSNQNASMRSKGKTIDEAIAAGLNLLHLSRDQVDINIIREGSRGILGIGAEEAVIEIIPKGVSAQPEKGTPSAPQEGLSAALAAEPLAKEAVQALSSVLEHMGITARVSARQGIDLADEGDPIPLVLDIAGKDLGILIGRRGETLQALQFMTRMLLSRQIETDQSIIIDVEGYRARRRRQLRQLALRMAERVAFSKQRIMLETMPASERRIIHIVLRDHPAVTTKSIGEGDQRKVTIIPK